MNPQQVPTYYHGRGIIVNRVLLTCMILVPLVLLALPKDALDHGPAMCLSVLLFDMECYGCGLTRAGMRMIHFDFAGAMEFNKLALIAIPLVAVLYGQEILRRMKHDPSIGPGMWARFPRFTAFIGKLK